jgi:hypothetical protein
VSTGATVVAAGERLLGVPVALDTYLGRPDRAVVARVRTDDGRTAVVKGPARPLDRDAAAGWWSPVDRFHNEWTSLQVLDGAGGVVPRLLGVDVDDLWMAIEDLGPVHSLADLLLGDSAADAEAGMVAWAGALGRLHAGTGDPALHERWRALRGEHGDPPTEESAATELAKLRSALPHLVIDDAVDAAVAPPVGHEHHGARPVLDAEQRVVRVPQDHARDPRPRLRRGAGQADDPLRQDDAQRQGRRGE